MYEMKHDIDIKITKNSEDKINEFDAKKYLDNYIKPSEANQEKEEKYNIILKNSDWIRCGILSMSIIVGVNFASNQSWWFKPIGRQTNVLAVLLVVYLLLISCLKRRNKNKDGCHAYAKDWLEFVKEIDNEKVPADSPLYRHTLYRIKNLH